MSASSYNLLVRAYRTDTTDLNCGKDSNVLCACMPLTTSLGTCGTHEGEVERHAAIRQILRVAGRAVPEARGGLLLPG